MKNFTINKKFKRLLSTILAFFMVGVSGSNFTSQEKKQSDDTIKTTSSSTDDLSASNLSIKWFDNPEIEKLVASFQSSDSSIYDETKVLDDLETDETTQQAVSTTTSAKRETKKQKKTKKKSTSTRVTTTTTLSRLQQIIKDSDIYDSYDDTVIYIYKTGKIYVVTGNRIVAEFKDEIAYGGSCKADPVEAEYGITSETETTIISTTTSTMSTTKATTTTTLSRLQQIIKNSNIYDSYDNTIIYQDRRTGEIYVVTGNRIVAEFKDEIAYGGSCKADPFEDKGEETGYAYTKRR